MESMALLVGHLIGDFVWQNDWMAANKRNNSWICLFHCICYTFAVALCCGWFLPWWSIVVVGILHFPVDRWGLARKFMSVNWQEKFATGPLAPWSIVVVDNTIHLIVLYVLGLVAVHNPKLW